MTRKFLFDTDFDNGASARRRAEKLRQAEAEAAAPSFSEEELAQARDEALAEGLERGREQALAEQRQSNDKLVSQTLARIADGLQSFGATFEGQASRNARDAVAIAMTVVRKLFPSVTEHHGLDEVHALIVECLRHLHEEPRIVIRLPDQHLDALSGQIQEIQAKSGYEGKVVLLAEDELDPGEVRVEWADGGAERDQQRLWADVEEILSHALKADTSAPTTPALDGSAPPDADPSRPAGPDADAAKELSDV